mmetsp:Transcript_3673/g.7771  ORF Transcript_3673/g.7771 Transcript_3673/m.7771 type:complete len:107 (-) Transcript_3673:558-878(-)
MIRVMGVTTVCRNLRKNAKGIFLLLQAMLIIFVPSRHLEYGAKLLGLLQYYRLLYDRLKRLNLLKELSNCIISGTKPFHMMSWKFLLIAMLTDNMPSAHVGTESAV